MGTIHSRSIHDYNTIILDRDGVINQHSSNYVLVTEELIIIQEAIIAINCFLRKNKSVFVATNQSPVGRGLMTLAELEKIHQCINRCLIRPIEFFVCTHMPEDCCNCRKPRPGLLESIKRKSKGPWLFIGDNVTDCLAAENASIDFVFIQSSLLSNVDELWAKRYTVYSNLYEVWTDLTK